MTPDFIIGFSREVLQLTFVVSAPLLGAGLLVGLVVSIFQSATQIQEVTLTFIPKILAVMAALVFFFPWILQMMLNFTANIFVNFPNMVR